MGNISLLYGISQSILRWNIQFINVGVDHPRVFFWLQARHVELDRALLQT